MIQNIEPHIYHNEYVPQRPGKDNYILYFEEGKLLVFWKQNQEETVQRREIQFLTLEDVEKENPNIYQEAIYLFAIDDQLFFLAEKLKYKTSVKGKECAWISREEFRTIQPGYLAFAGITAYQLQRWYGSHKFCGRCGSPMKRDGKERMLYCERCHQMEYPKICPAVIVGVTDGDRIVLTKYAGRTYKKYALIAGFAEIGETIEDTVRREVMEEVGLSVKNITYYKSQPWSFTDTLLFGFFAEVDGAREIHLDEEELSVAEWFERSEIPDVVSSESLTNEMMMYFKNQKEVKENELE